MALVRDNRQKQELLIHREVPLQLRISRHQNQPKLLNLQRLKQLLSKGKNLLQHQVSYNNKEN
jgi:hypothetical protein